MEESSCFLAFFPLPFLVSRIVTDKRVLQARTSMPYQQIGQVCSLKRGVAFAMSRIQLDQSNDIATLSFPVLKNRGFSRKLMKKLQNLFPEYEFVFYHRLCADEYAVILSKNGSYAVCRMKPRHRVVIAPNYLSEGGGVLAAPLTSAGLEDLLQWDTFKVALSRFHQMFGLSEGVVRLFPEAKHAALK